MISMLTYAVNTTGHHSLVTPIDWKRGAGAVGVDHDVGHHSLVTPIDWKPSGVVLIAFTGLARHHSLVTPIDWKHRQPMQVACTTKLVTTRW